MGVGVSDDDDDVIIVGETLARADSDDAPPSKRARPDEAPSRPVESLGNNASAGETTRDPPRSGCSPPAAFATNTTADVRPSRTSSPVPSGGPSP